MAPRETTAQVLDPAEHESPGDVELALEALLDPARPIEVRVRAAKELAELRDTRVVVPLAIAYAECSRTEATLEGVLERLLDRLGAVELMSRELASPSAPVRLRAARVLGMLRNSRAMAALTSALSDPHPRVREQAASALYWFRDERTLPALARLLATDPDADVRSAAAQAIGELPGDEARVVLTRAAAREADAFVIISIERARARQDAVTDDLSLLACG